MNEIKFSLILCTVDRTDLLEEFMKELVYQEYKNFELILVDQNTDGRIDNIINKFEKSYNIKHLKSKKGLSRARNVGLKYVEGDIVAFPDDDCIYPHDLLKKVKKFFDENKEYDILSIKMTNSVVGGRKIQEKTLDQVVEKIDVMTLIGSISMFIKKDVIEILGGFDERLGLGAETIFQGGEDYDYPLRAIEEGFTVYYDRSIEVFHPWDDMELDLKKDLTKKSYNGGAAEMFLLNKHEFSTVYKIKRVIRRMIVIIYYLFKFNLYKAKLSYLILRGMIDYFNVETNTEKGQVYVIE